MPPVVSQPVGWVPVRTLALACALALALVSQSHAAPSQISEKDRARIEKAERAIEEHDYARAIRLLRKVRSGEGACHECLKALATAYSGFGDYRAAAATLRELIDATPPAELPYDLYNDLGHALFSLAYMPTPEEYVEAVDEFGKDVSSEAIDSRWNQFWQKRRKSVLAEAEEAFRTAIEIGGEQTNLVRVNLAQTQYRQGKFDEARATIEEHLAAEPVAEGAADLQFCATQRLTFPQGIAGLGGAYLVANEIAPPKRRSDAPPQYSEVARREGVEGLVVLEALIDERGKVRCPRILKSVPFLDLAAHAAVSQWEYEPATKDGAPVPVVHNLVVNFQLRPSPIP